MAKKRFISLLMVMCMVLTFIPAQLVAFADDESVTVGDTVIEADTYYVTSADGEISTEDADEDNYNLYYDSGTATITLNDATLTDTLYVPPL